jgi:hypothetical protein
MAKGATTSFSAATNRDFAEQNTEQAIRVMNYGVNFVREIAEQNINQSKMLLHSLLTITKKVVDEIDQQSSDFRHRSMSLAEETFLNTFDFAQKVVRAREPQELAQIQNEFVGRQTQAVVDQAKELGQTMMQQANEMAKTTNQEEVTVLSRRRAEAA